MQRSRRTRFRIALGGHLPSWRATVGVLEHFSPEKIKIESDHHDDLPSRYFLDSFNALHCSVNDQRESSNGKGCTVPSSSASGTSKGGRSKSLASSRTALLTALISSRSSASLASASVRNRSRRS